MEYSLSGKTGTWRLNIWGDLISRVFIDRKPEDLDKFRGLSFYPCGSVFIVVPVGATFMLRRQHGSFPGYGVYYTVFRSVQITPKEDKFREEHYHFRVIKNSEGEGKKHTSFRTLEYISCLDHDTLYGITSKEEQAAGGSPQSKGVT